MRLRVCFTPSQSLTAIYDGICECFDGRRVHSRIGFRAERSFHESHESGHAILI